MIWYVICLGEISWKVPTTPDTHDTQFKYGGIAQGTLAVTQVIINCTDSCIVFDELRMN